jgi:hypothetical protein
MPILFVTNVWKNVKKPAIIIRAPGIVQRSVDGRNSEND